MKNKYVLLFSLITLGLFTLVDIIEDTTETIDFFHIAIELSIFFIVIFVITHLVKEILIVEESLQEEIQHNKQLQTDLENYHQQIKELRKGLYQVIVSQFSQWQLTSSEQEIAWFILKGIDSKSIAEIRQTSEKTVTNQISSILKKSGLSSRNQFISFFLEDLLSGSDGAVSQHQ